MSTFPAFTLISDEAFINLVTVRKNGNEVATPVWFAQDQASGVLYVETEEDSGKVKRIRHTSRVTLAPCNFRGKIKGDVLPGNARIATSPAEIFRAKGTLHRKYGLQRQLFYAVMEVLRLLRREPAERLIYIAIEPQQS